MAEKEERYTKIYKSVKNRRNIALPLELHKILKLEAANQGKTIREILVEALKTYLKI